MSGATNWRYIAFLWQITISKVFHSRLNTFSPHQPQKPTTFSPTFYNTGISSEWDMWRHDALREGLVIEESGSYRGMLQLLRQDCAMLWATRESAVLVLYWVYRENKSNCKRGRFSRNVFLKRNQFLIHSSVPTDLGQFQYVPLRTEGNFL